MCSMTTGAVFSEVLKPAWHSRKYACADRESPWAQQCNQLAVAQHGARQYVRVKLTVRTSCSTIAYRTVTDHRGDAECTVCDCDHTLQTHAVRTNVAETTFGAVIPFFLLSCHTAANKEQAASTH